MDADLDKAARATKTISSRILDGFPIAVEYRPGLWEGKVGQARRSAIESFTGLLAQTSQVKATNPRDKVFALESLLPKRCLGRLINVDYSEDVSDVFRRATARSFNSTDSGQLYLMVRFNFLFESQLRKGEELSGPSWVLDLTYSDAALRSNKVGNWRRPVGVTLDGYLYQNRTPEDNNQVPCRVTFATPESLYCAGCSIDQVRWVAEIPALTVEHASKELLMFAVKINLERRIILGLGVPSDYVDHLTIPTNPDVIQITSSMRFLSLLADEDSLEDTIPSGPSPGEHRLTFLDIFLQERNFNLAGKTCFITQWGLVGIATSPIRPGDKLCWVNTALVYLVLRDACNDNEGGANSMHKHRIVARAAVSEKQSMMQALIQSSQVQGFQIV